MGRVVRNEFALSNESTKETEPYENKSSTQDTEIKGEIEPVAQQDKNSCLLLTLYSLVADKCEICIEHVVHEIHGERSTACNGCFGWKKKPTSTSESEANGRH